MHPTDSLFLTINGGSSSIKFAIFEAGGTQLRRLGGSIERIGLPNSIFKARGQAGIDDFTKAVTIPDQKAAVTLLIEWVRRYRDLGKLVGIGHRIVHGGPKYGQPQGVTPQLLADLQGMQAFDPQHLPEEIALIQAFAEAFPDLPQVACFDTAFHHGMPRVAKLLALPRQYEAQGVRRYGFHGLSYTFLMDELARVAGVEAAKGRIILAHLGNGASLAAVHFGKPVDTSMGFTPASGVMMGTRSGDVDPGLFAYLARTQNMKISAFDDMVNFKSGLLGISETSSDMAELLLAQARDVRAAEAVAMFCYQIKKCIGAFTAALGGLDQLVFAGGIGEHSAPIRARICDGLGFLGVKVDPARNERHAPVISSLAGRVPVRVIRTDEEQVIAMEMTRCLELVGKAGAVVLPT